MTNTRRFGVGNLFPVGLILIFFCPARLFLLLPSSARSLNAELDDVFTGEMEKKKALLRLTDVTPSQPRRPK